MRALKINDRGVQEIELGDTERETIAQEIRWKLYEGMGQPAPGHLCLKNRYVSEAVSDQLIEIQCDWLNNPTFNDMLVVGIRGVELTDATLGAHALSNMVTINAAVA